MSQAELDKCVRELRRLLEQDKKRQREMAIKMAAKVAELRAIGLNPGQARLLERAVARRVKRTSK